MRRASAAAAQQRRSVRSCCSASSSVGAISAVWLPASATASRREQRDHRLAAADVALRAGAASGAAARGRRASRPRRAAARASGETAAPRAPRPHAPAVSGDRDRRLARAALAAQREAELEQVELLEDEPRVRRACAPARSASRSTSTRRLVQRRAAPARGSGSAQLAHQRRRQVARAPGPRTARRRAAPRAAARAGGRPRASRSPARCCAGRARSPASGACVPSTSISGCDQLLREAVAPHVAGDEQAARPCARASRSPRRRGTT